MSIELTDADLIEIDRVQCEIYDAHSGEGVYTDVNAIYRAGIAAGIERSAKACETVEVAGVKIIGKTEHYPGEYASECDIGYASGCDDCAAAIRALKE
jgi:hypothetical protein